MNNRNQQQTNRTPAPAQQSLPGSSDGRAVRASMHSPGTASQRRDSDSPSGHDASVATSCINLTYFNVFTVEKYETNGKTQKKWTRIGAAFSHKEGIGFSIELKAFPVDGRLVVLPPDNDDRSNK
jgi:hypothetical protein